MSNTIPLTVIHKLLGQSNNLGSALTLFLYLLCNAKADGTVETNYHILSKSLKTKVPSLKVWRSKLLKNHMIKTYTKDHHVVFALSSEWTTMINQKTDNNEMKIENSNNLVAVIIEDLAQKIADKIELQKS